MTIYHIARWADLFENNRSRRVKDLAWVPIPNNHDGEKYSRLMHHKEAAKIYAAWVLLLQVASKCHPRGSLVRDDGTPLDPDALAFKTRAPAAWFDLALPVLTEIGWLVTEVNEQLELAASCHHGDTTVPPRCQHGDEEGNGKKGMERKKEVGQCAGQPAPTSNDSDWLGAISADPTYAGLNVGQEFGKMKTWCSANRKEPTRRRFVNWLNRAERPMGQAVVWHQPIKQPAEPGGWRAWLAKEYPGNLVTVENRPWASVGADIQCEAMAALGGPK